MRKKEKEKRQIFRRLVPVVVVIIILSGQGRIKYKVRCVRFKVMTDSASKYISDDIEVSSPPDTLPFFLYEIIQSEQVQLETAWFPQFLLLWP